MTSHEQPFSDQNKEGPPEVPQKPNSEINESEIGSDVPVKDKKQDDNLADALEKFSDGNQKMYAEIVQNFENQDSDDTKSSLYEDIKKAVKLPHDDIFNFYMEHKDELTEKDKNYLHTTIAIKKGYVKNDNSQNDKSEAEKRSNDPEKIPVSSSPLAKDTREFIAEIDDKLSHGEDSSEFTSRYIKEFLINNGFSKEETEKMTDQTATDALREKIKETDRQNLSETEKKKEKEIQEALEQTKNNTEQEAEKAGILGRVRKIGELYNKVPLKYKLLIGAALGIGSVALSGTAAAGCTLCLFSQRVLGGTGTFVMIEGLLQHAAEKDGRERTKLEKRRHAVEAAILGVAVGSRGISMLYDYFDSPDVLLENTATEVGPDTIPDTPPIPTETPPPEITENLNVNASSEGADPLSKIFDAPKAVASGITETSAAETEFSFTVGGETGTLWDGIEETLQEQGYFKELDEGRQTFLIDSIKDKFATMSPEELREIGISSGNIDLVHSGETINLSSVLEDATSVDKLAEQACDLPDSVSDHIWAQEHPNEALSGNKISDVISSTPETDIIDNAPLETTPNTPVLGPETFATHTLNEDLNNLYGNLENDPNIPGERSTHWIGENGLSEQTVKTVMTTNSSFLNSEGVGIESSDAVSATQEHVKHLIKGSDLYPQQNETVKDFFERAHNEIYSPKK